MSDRIAALLEPIQERWASATPGPWESDGVDIVQTEKNWSTVLENNVSCMSYCYGGSVQQEIKPADKAAILAAPTDVARLLAAVQAVTELAANWEARGEHDMAYSKTIPDEDIAMALLTDGATMVENARHIRNALEAALGGEA